jgi:hypothetical protein
MSLVIVRHINLDFPRDPRSTCTEIRVGLLDVRAADDLIIDYDFERDGWRIRMATVHESLDDMARDPKLVEVAFCPARVGGAP